MTPTEIKSLREDMLLTQAAFAERFDLPLGTLRDWEQGRKTPNQSACNYLRVIRLDSGFAEFALGKLRQQPRRSGGFGPIVIYAPEFCEIAPEV
jgi:transcriptional regulator with XRE-family HTH domain